MLHVFGALMPVVVLVLAFLFFVFLGFDGHGVCPGGIQGCMVRLCRRFFVDISVLCGIDFALCWLVVHYFVCRHLPVLLTAVEYERSLYISDLSGIHDQK